ncbi:unnamed protein product [Taenia asiatica]|uniref:Uncharacterized protein n=1 Tax=Taenia asiatica TaxID=60517 RepID=A0A0R3W0D2_TAEAS|nr:unnamed protein product [Taenia asiatica]
MAAGSDTEEIKSAVLYQLSYPDSQRATHPTPTGHLPTRQAHLLLTQAMCFRTYPPLNPQERCHARLLPLPPPPPASYCSCSPRSPVRRASGAST